MWLLAGLHLKTGGGGSGDRINPASQKLDDTGDMSSGNLSLLTLTMTSPPPPTGDCRGHCATRYCCMNIETDE